MLGELAQKGLHDATLAADLMSVHDASGELASVINEWMNVHENLSKAQAYLDDASHERSRAATLIQSQDWNGSVEASQHCIEHSIKSLFMLVGVEHPREHDPTKKFEAVIGRLKDLPDWRLKGLARIRWIARVWATMHEESIYAFSNIPAKDLLAETDAKVLIGYAEETYYASERLVTNVRFRQVRIRT